MDYLGLRSVFTKGIVGQNRANQDGQYFCAKLKGVKNHKSMQITFAVGDSQKMDPIQQILANVSWRSIQIVLHPDSLIEWMI